MKNKPLISVIITNYNYGKYVPKAIESVLNQTYKNIELIVINDGSTDNSDEIIKKILTKCPDRNINYVSHENRGVVYTRNQGLELAQGDFLCYLDADDYFNNDYIEKNYNIAKRYGADVVYPNWHFVGEWLGRPDTNFPEFTPELLQLQKLHCKPESLVRKKAIKDHRFETEKVAEDWDFFIGLSLDGAKFKLAKNNFINYRISTGSRGSRNDPKEDTQSFVDILTKYKNKYDDKVIDPNRLVKLRHPNIVMKVLSMRYPKVVMESVKKDGARTTSIKAIRKVAIHNKWAWNTLWRVRNNKYKRTIRSFAIQKSPNTKLAVVLHLYYIDLWPSIMKKLSSIDVPFDLFVSVQIKDKDISLDKINKYHKMTNIVALPNRGRDMLPFMMIVSKLCEDTNQYRYLLKIHSKKSLHRDDGNEWLNSLLGQLIPNDISNVIKVLEDRKTGLVGPADHVVSLSKYMGDNKERIRKIAETMTDKKTVKQMLDSPSKYPFFGGTMFWGRLDFLTPLLECGITPADFNTERGQIDGTTAHAIERILGKILHTVTQKKMYVVDKAIVSQLPEKSYTANYKHVG